jgi:hypothetical protein
MNVNRAARAASIGSAALLAAATLTMAVTPIASASDQQCGMSFVGQDLSQQVCLYVTGSGLKVSAIQGNWAGTPPTAPVFQFYVNGTLNLDPPLIVGFDQRVNVVDAL